MAGNFVIDRAESLLDSDASAMFSPDRAYRYALTRLWDAEKPAAVFIMLNPSTADAFTLDPTVRRCIGFAQRWEKGGLIVLNAFALRSTNPRALYAHPDPVGRLNDPVIASYTRQYSDGRAIVIWGAHGAHRNRANRVTRLLASMGVETLCLGVTKDGHPRHPLYVRGDVEPVRWQP